MATAVPNLNFNGNLEKLNIMMLEDSVRNYQGESKIFWWLDVSMTKVKVYCDSLTYSLTYPLTHSLTYPLTYSLSYSLTHLPTHSFLLAN